MYVCRACHEGCPTSHVMVTFGPCEVCRREDECVDCVSSKPVTRAELDEAARVRELASRGQRVMYRHSGRLEYPRGSET